jgi:hypothetical protein
MKLALGIASAISLGMGISVTNVQPATAATLVLPYGTSDYIFSITPTPPSSLEVVPVVSIDPNGCPGAGCPSSFWDFGFTVDFYNQTNNLLASNSGSVSENCTPSDCSVPKPVIFSIPPDAVSFEIINDMSVGGGWLFDSASEFISAGDSQIAETPIPAALTLFATGLGVMGLLERQRKRKKSKPPA